MLPKLGSPSHIQRFALATPNESQKAPERGGSHCVQFWCPRLGHLLLSSDHSIFD